MSNRFKSVVCADLLMTRRINGATYILLMKRINTGYDDGKYELPGGHLEDNEDLYDAMIREAKEELLIDLCRGDIHMVHLLHHFTGNRLNFIFEVDGQNYNPKIGEVNKCEELRWVKMDDLPDTTTDKVKLMISNIIKKQFYDKM